MAAKRNRRSRKASAQLPLLLHTADEINKEYLANLERSEGIVFVRLKRFVAPLHQVKIQTLKESGEERPAIKALDFLGEILRAAYPEVQADIEAKNPIPQDADDKIRATIQQSR